MIKWSVTEVAPHEWWAADTSTGVAYSLPPATGEPLWRVGDPLEPLASQLADVLASAARPHPPTIDLHFAGVAARYLVEDDETAARLATEFAAAVPKLRSTPDLLVRISAEADLDRLHRAVPHERMGVWTRDPGQSQWLPADHDLPVLPPIQRTSLASQFAAIHAALVLTDRSATIIAGRQKSGKTTAAVLAERSGLGAAATDELVLLSRRALVYGVPLPMRIRSDTGRGIQPVPSSSVLERQPCRASRLILLDETTDVPGLSPIVDYAAALAELSQHLRPLDLSLGETARLALELLAEVSVWRLSCRGWPDLHADLDAGLHELTEATVS
jgi:hypothetical protein